MRERRRRGRVGEVVGRHVDGLHRSDRTVGRRRNALLQKTHFPRKRRLISDGGRNAAEERRYFGTCLHETEYVVHEKEYVFAAFIAERFGHGEARERDAGASARHFVHLAEYERGRFEHAGFFHFVVKIV